MVVSKCWRVILSVWSGNRKFRPVTLISLSPQSALAFTLSPISKLDDVKVGDWLASVSTSKPASDPVLQQVATVTTGLVKTKNYTFRKDGRTFFNHYKSLTARPATTAEIDKWLSRQRQTKSLSNDRYNERPDVVLARYLASVGEDKWLQLGLPMFEEDQDSVRENTHCEIPT